MYYNLQPQSKSVKKDFQLWPLTFTKIFSWPLTLLHLFSLSFPALLYSRSFDHLPKTFDHRPSLWNCLVHWCRLTAFADCSKEDIGVTPPWQCTSSEGLQKHVLQHLGALSCICIDSQKRIKITRCAFILFNTSSYNAGDKKTLY